jgi:oxalate decarboxylase/phosphoglucose isomerase-like protein (cupin superfamily)
MTFAHYEFAVGSSIHEHFHPEEEVYEVIEGELEVTIDDKPRIVKPGVVAIVPANSRHSVRALTDGRLIVVDQPARPDFGYVEPQHTLGYSLRRLILIGRLTRKRPQKPHERVVGKLPTESGRYAVLRPDERRAFVNTDGLPRTEPLTFV